MTDSTMASRLEVSADPDRLTERFVRRLARPALQRLTKGRIVVQEGTRRIEAFGPEDAKSVVVYVHSRRVYRRLVLEGSLGAARSWIDGDWSCDDLPALMRMLVSEPDFVGPRGRLDSPAARLASLVRRATSRLTRNSVSGSRRNIAAHYDLGNDFYEAMLDPSMTYSAALFSPGTHSLEAAQFEKYDRLCRQLDLRPEHRLLEIGTGWGGFALHAARHYGCHVTTTTISRAQFAVAERRVKALGLESRIDLRLEDYRKLTGQYDRLVSIEMIEAVGEEYLDLFFGICSDRLHPDGMMGLQAIVIADQAYERSRRHVDFIKRYVFPGGFLPSIASISDRVARVTDFRMQSLRDLTPDYAETLRCWRANLEARPAAYQTVDGGPEFRRLWEYYLAYCEAGFEERHIGCVQVTLTKSGWRPTPA